MELLKLSNITTDVLEERNIKPLVFCSESSRLIRRLGEAYYQTIDINRELSQELIQFDKNERVKEIESSLKKLTNCYSPIYLTGIEMLFDPRYEIDVLRFFCEKARIINVAIKWPGQFTDGKLTYATPEDPDYHEFDCNAYQIRIVQ